MMPAKPLASRVSLTLRHPDIRSLLIIFFAFVLLIILFPSARDYPVSDECVYVPALANFRTTLVYTIPDYAQTSLVGLIWLGWIWSALFGFSLTQISLLMLTLSLATLVRFYLLLRELTVAPNAALLGVALLGFNPIYLHHSYIYMTEIPFLGLLFYACLCYLRGLRGMGEWWFWLGSSLVAYNFLIRQYAALIPIALLLYLSLKGWRWRSAIAATLPAALVGALFVYWQQSQPPNTATLIQQQTSDFILTARWPLVFLTRAFAYMPLLGLFTWPLPRLRRAASLLPWLAVALIGVGSYVLQLGAGATLFRNSLDYDGNALTRAGFTFFLYNPAPTLSDAAWGGIMLLGVGLSIVLLAQISESLAQCWRERATWRIQAQPTLLLYILALLIAVTTYAFSGLSFDRYTLAFVPMLIIFIVRRSDKWKRGWSYMVIATLLLASFSLSLQADYADHAAARWQAGQSLIAQGVKPTDIWAGSEWLTWYNASADPQRPYAIADQSPSGYRLVARLPYFSRLGGFTTRYVGIWEQNGAATSP